MWPQFKQFYEALKYVQTWVIWLGQGSHGKSFFACPRQKVWLIRHKKLSLAHTNHYLHRKRHVDVSKRVPLSINGADGDAPVVGREPGQLGNVVGDLKRDGLLA